jgi:hypothetical protein
MVEVRVVATFTNLALSNLIEDRSAPAGRYAVAAKGWRSVIPADVFRGTTGDALSALSAGSVAPASAEAAIIEQQIASNWCLR